jgi:hypothetical protein
MGRLLVGGPSQDPLAGNDPFPKPLDLARGCIDFRPIGVALRLTPRPGFVVLEIDPGGFQIVPAELQQSFG